MNTKWKDSLLKTGLPLEFLTAVEFESKGHSSWGEYPYLKRNENGILTEFSVDIHSYKDFDFTTHSTVLSILAECKHRQPGTSWIFLPHDSGLHRKGLVCVLDSISPLSSRSHALDDFEQGFRRGLGVVEINNSGGNSSGVKHGVTQLRYGIPMLMKSSYHRLLENLRRRPCPTYTLCPMLVTTACIRVMKIGMQMKDFTSAEALDDVTEEIPAIVYEQEPGPLLEMYAKDAADEVFLGGEMSSRARVMGNKTPTGSDASISYGLEIAKSRFTAAVNSVLVVNFDHIGDVLEKLDVAVNEYYSDITIHGEYVFSDDGVANIRRADGVMLFAGDSYDPIFSSSADVENNTQ